MTAKRDTLITRVIHLLGFEHPMTVDFVRYCESFPNTQAFDLYLETVVDRMEKSDIWGG